MAMFVAFDMNASASDRLNALFKAAPKPHLPHLQDLTRKNSLASVHVQEINGSVASSSWSISSAGSTRPGSIMEGKERRQSKGLRSMFSRNKMGGGHGKVEVIEEEGNAPMRSHEELHRALELTALELQEDISKSSTEPVVAPISMNPFMTYIATPPTETESDAISAQLEQNLKMATESETSDNLNIHSIIAKAKRMSITSVRPSTATSTMSTPSSPMPSQAPPTKKRSSIFPQRSSRTGSSSSKSTEMATEGQEFFKALKEAKKHSTLSTSKLSSDAIITMSKWKEGEVLSPSHTILEEKKAEKAKMKLKKQISDVINKSGWMNKVYVLTAGSLASPPYILQFAPAGAASRVAERTLQVTKQSRAFVTDAIPGRHWVLQVSQLLEVLANGDMKKSGSRMSFRPSEKIEKLANMLLVLDSGDDMEEWLTALRHEIDVLGGKGKHVEAVAEVPTDEVVEIKMGKDEKPYPTSSLSHESNLTRRDQPTSESDRGSWSGASQRQSACYSYQRPSVDAASSTMTSPEDRKLESLRNSGQSRMTYDNAPPTPASSTHSPAQSVSSSPTFLFDDSPPEIEDDRAARAGYEYKATRQPPAIPTDVNILRSNSMAVAERRRSYQTQPTSPLVTEISRPSTASAETGPITDAAPQRKRSVRFPPTTFENGAHLSVVPDQPSPASFHHESMPEVNPLHLDIDHEDESRDQFPTREMELELEKHLETLPEIPIPPRSKRRQSLQAPMKLDLVPEVAALTSPDPPTSPEKTVFEKRVGKQGSGGSGGAVKIQFWGPTASAPHSRSVSREEKLDTLPEMGLSPPSIQSQMRSLKPLRSRASLGRSDPFDLQTHLAAVSPILAPSDNERYSFATSDSAYSDSLDPRDSWAEHGDVDFDPNPSPSMLPLPLSPLNLPDMTSPIARANAKAMSLRAERAAKRDSWGTQQRNPVHRPTSFRRDSRTGPVFRDTSPPKPLSARGFINLAASGSVNAEKVVHMMESSAGMTRLKRSASDAASSPPMELSRPTNYRASTVPYTSVHIGAIIAPGAQMVRKTSLPRRSPVLGSTPEHPAQYTRASARNMVPAVGPMLPPPQSPLPGVPSRINSVRSHRSNGSGSGTASSLSIRYEDEVGRSW